jgi:hypothetical protein
VARDNGTDLPAFLRVERASIVIVTFAPVAATAGASLTAGPRRRACSAASSIVEEANVRARKVEPERPPLVASRDPDTRVCLARLDGSRETADSARRAASSSEIHVDVPRVAGRNMDTSG